MAEPIEMPFGLRTWVGPRNHVLDGGPHPPENGQFWGRGRPIVKYGDTAVICAKTAEPIEMPFGLWTRLGRRKHGGQIGATWRKRLNRSCAAAMKNYVKLFLPL